MSQQVYYIPKLAC